MLEVTYLYSNEININLIISNRAIINIGMVIAILDSITMTGYPGSSLTCRPKVPTEGDWHDLSIIRIT